MANTHGCNVALTPLASMRIQRLVLLKFALSAAQSTSEKKRRSCGATSVSGAVCCATTPPPTHSRFGHVCVQQRERKQAAGESVQKCCNGFREKTICDKGHDGSQARWRRVFGGGCVDATRRIRVGCPTDRG